MILFVKLSERRWLVFDVDTKPSGYTGVGGRGPSTGYLTVNARWVTIKPVTYTKARDAAETYCKANNLLIDYDKWVVTIPNVGKPKGR
jgi:hypothetical protein